MEQQGPHPLHPSVGKDYQGPPRRQLEHRLGSFSPECLDESRILELSGETTEFPTLQLQLAAQLGPVAALTLYPLGDPWLTSHEGGASLPN